MGKQSNQLKSGRVKVIVSHLVVTSAMPNGESRQVRPFLRPDNVESMSYLRNYNFYVV